MAEGKLQSADFEEEPLPGAKAPDFDLSDETAVRNGNGEPDEEQPEAGAQGEPEGVFALFDREFPEEPRVPIEPRESLEFDEEFSKSFETMFRNIQGDDSAPLFEDSPELPDEKSNLESEEADLLPIPQPEPESQPQPPQPSVEELEDFSFDDEPLEFTPVDSPVSAPAEPQQRRGIPFAGADEDDDEDESPYSLAGSSSLSMDEDDSVLTLSEGHAPSDELEGWGVEESGGLEEFSFDDSEEEQIFDRDLSGLIEEEDDSEEASFDDFAKMALGMEEDEDDDGDLEDEEDDFVLEELSQAKPLDPFDEIAIMSSEDVAQYEPSFGEEELKFQDEPLPSDEDDDPFAMNGGARAEDDEEESLAELDPFGEKAAELAAASKASPSTDSDSEDGPAEDDAEEGDSGDKEKLETKRKREKSKSGGGSKAGGAIVGLLSIPWKLFSTLTGILFGVLESVIGLLGKIPLIGLPFRLLSSVLSAVPMALKRLIVLLLIVIFFWGGSALVGSFLPKPSTEVSLPDLGGASFSSVELKDGQITGEIENTGDVNLFLFPEVQVSERKVLQPGSWFSPVDLGTCRGPLTEVAVDTTVKVSFGCDVATDSSSSLKPALKE